MSTDHPLNISLPSSVNDFVAGRVSAGGYSDAAQYVFALIEADRINHAREELDQLIQAGIDSGPGRVISESEWESKIRLLQERHAGAKQP